MYNDAGSLRAYTFTYIKCIGKSKTKIDSFDCETVWRETGDEAKTFGSRVRRLTLKSNLWDIRAKLPQLSETINFEGDQHEAENIFIWRKMFQSLKN